MEEKMRNSLCSMYFFVVALIGGLLALQGPAYANEVAKDIRVVGGVLGGNVNRSHAAFGQAYMKEHPGTSVDILPGGAVANPTRIQRGDGEVSHTQTIVLKAAAEGTEPYKQKHDALRSLFRIGDETRLHFIARDSAPFATLDEIREKQIPISLAMSPKGSTNELYGRWVLNAYGITYDDIKKWGGKVNFSAYDNVVNSMKDNQIDMLVWVGAGEPVFMQEVALGQKLRWLPVKEEVMELVRQKGLKPTVIRGAEFNGMVGQDTPCLTDTNEIFCREDVPEETIYEITKTWMEHAPEIVEVNPGWRTLDPQTAGKETTLPMHPGAERYFREKGLR